MQENFSVVAMFIKFIALILGSILGLILSGDIDTNGKLSINPMVGLKFCCSLGIGLFFGEFFIDHLDWEHMNIYAQCAILMSFAVFGMLVLGILYRSIQLTLQEKKLSEIILEIKQTIKSILK